MDAIEPLVNGDVCGFEQGAAIVSEIDVNAAAVTGSGIAAHEAARDQAVDDTGHARPADRELFSQRRGGLLALTENPEHAVLGEGEIDAPDRALDLACQARDRAPRVAGGADARLGRYFGSHMVRVANYRDGPAAAATPGAPVKVNL